MSATLEQIVASTRRRVGEAKAQADLREMARQAAEHKPRGFGEALRRKAADGIAVIAELKKASPSRGVIRGTFHVAGLARELADAGAAALSVLTEEEFFQGSLDNLREASSAVPLPCLRKDFIVDEIQILEARANDADAVLLIVAALNAAELRRLHECARGHGLDVLCEVHDEDELTRALDVGCEIIGVNSRNLRTFEVDLNIALNLASKIPAQVLRIAESGVRSGQDLAVLSSAGFEAFLVGESLMRAARPGNELAKFIAEAKRERAAARS